MQIKAITLIGNKIFINNMIITPVKVSKVFLIKIQGIFTIGYKGDPQ
jgi:hypothetical protein